MNEDEKRKFLLYLENLTPEYRKKILKRLQNNYKSNVRAKTKKYMKEHNISFNECIMCGEKYYIEIHHIDYTRPYVISPLCIKCHRRQHSKNAFKIKFIDLQNYIKGER